MPGLRAVTAGLFVGAAATVGLLTALPVLVTASFGLPGAALGPLLAVAGLGALIGPLPIPRLMGRLPGPLLVAGTALAQLMAVVVLVLTPSLPWLVAMLLASGLLATARDRAATITARRLVPAPALAATRRFQHAVVVMGQLTGAVTVGLLTGFRPSAEALVIAAGAGAALTLIALLDGRILDIGRGRWADAGVRWQSK
jgi:predicted MFS family arabinose efflux permease